MILHCSILIYKCIPDSNIMQTIIIIITLFTKSTKEWQIGNSSIMHNTHDILFTNFHYFLDHSSSFAKIRQIPSPNTRLRLDQSSKWWTCGDSRAGLWLMAMVILAKWRTFHVLYISTLAVQKCMNELKLKRQHHFNIRKLFYTIKVIVISTKVLRYIYIKWKFLIYVSLHISTLIKVFDK